MDRVGEFQAADEQSSGDDDDGSRLGNECDP